MLFLQYGPTGSGKTFTLEGEGGCASVERGDLCETAGVLPRAIMYLLKAACALTLSCFEIYNDLPRDLLSEVGPRDSEHLPSVSSESAGAFRR